MKILLYNLLLILFAGCSRCEMSSDLLAVLSERKNVQTFQKAQGCPRFEIWQYKTQEKINAEVEICIFPLGYNAPSNRSLERWIYDPYFADKERVPYKGTSDWNITQTRVYEIRFTISR